MAGSAPDAPTLVIGRVIGPFGVRGWVRAVSYTRPPENLADYPRWWLAGTGGDVRCVEVLEARPHGSGVVARLAGCDDRDAAQALARADIRLPRSELEAPAAGEYYWADLVGLDVVNADDVPLGRVTGLLETGANDVLVVADEHRERLIPFTPGRHVLDVDIAARRIRVDWHPDD